MSPTEWLTKFNYAVQHNDQKSLKQISPTTKVFMKLKKELSDGGNARRRDIVRQTEIDNTPRACKSTYTDYEYSKKSYTMDDYLKLDEQRAGYLDSDTYSSGNRYLSNTIEFQVGDQVKFVAKDHYYENQNGIILEKRGKTFLIEITSKGAPKTGTNGMVRTTADCLEKRLANAG